MATRIELKDSGGVFNKELAVAYKLYSLESKAAALYRCVGNALVCVKA